MPFLRIFEAKNPSHYIFSIHLYLSHTWGSESSDPLFPLLTPISLMWRYILATISSYCNHAIGSVTRGFLGERIAKAGGRRMVDIALEWLRCLIPWSGVDVLDLTLHIAQLKGV